ncbi:MAG: DUF2237 domain-containing protein [Proteobacteria bacterium]|nr:DUF2237 domain-containing protein [Burkholderiales bacterium]
MDGSHGGGSTQLNVLGAPLATCSIQPVTGYFRTGCCETAPDDVGSHTVCCEVTQEFLAYSKRQGNDLSTPMPAYGFAGLHPGDRWCVCVSRWKEAFDAGVAPKVVLAATHRAALAVVTLEALRDHALDA